MDTDPFEALAGESGSAAKNLRQHLGGLDSSELLNIADDLTALLAHPGWQKLEELAAIQKNAIEHGAMRRLWSHFAAGATVQQQAPFVRLGGVIDGLGRHARTIQTVLRMAGVVRLQLERENNGEGR